MNDMNGHDDSIRWNKDKHDDHGKKEAQERVKRIMGKVWETWKREFLSRKRSPQEILDSLQNLKDEMIKRVTDETPAAWLEYTMKLIDDKTADVMAGMMLMENQITEFVPEGRKSEPKVAPFKFNSDFENIGFVARFKGLSGFIGFVRSDKTIYALFDDEEMITVGECANTVSILQYPTASKFWEALQKNAANN